MAEKSGAWKGKKQEGGGGKGGSGSRLLIEKHKRWEGRRSVVGNGKNWKKMEIRKTGKGSILPHMLFFVLFCVMVCCL